MCCKRCQMLLLIRGLKATSDLRELASPRRQGSGAFASTNSTNVALSPTSPSHYVYIRRDKGQIWPDLMRWTADSLRCFFCFKWSCKAWRYTDKFKDFFLHAGYLRLAELFKKKYAKRWQHICMFVGNHLICGMTIMDNMVWYDFIMVYYAILIIFDVTTLKHAKHLSCVSCCIRW